MGDPLEFVTFVIYLIYCILICKSIKIKMEYDLVLYIKDWCRKVLE